MKIVMTAAVFDLCHRGHLNILKAMRAEAGVDGLVVVFLHDDKSIYDTKGKIPIQSFEQRKRNLEITELVDVIYCVSDYNDLAIGIRMAYDEYFKKLDGAIWMRGDDWTDFPARKTIEELGIKIKFLPYTVGISSSLIRSGLEGL